MARIVGLREIFRFMYLNRGLTVRFVVENNSRKGIWLKSEVKLSGYMQEINYKYTLEIQQKDSYIAPKRNRQFLTKSVFNKNFPFLLFKVYEFKFDGKRGKKVRLLHTGSDIVGFWRFYWNNDIKRDEVIAKICYKIRGILYKFKLLWLNIKWIYKLIKNKWKRSLKEWGEKRVMSTKTIMICDTCGEESTEIIKKEIEMSKEEQCEIPIKLLENLLVAFAKQSNLLKPIRNGGVNGKICLNKKKCEIYNEVEKINIWFTGKIVERVGKI